ncbi:iron complex outermembrane recepter protein [Desulfacinum hydrothermale DSM 13146]|uniref:Iron complex outermembrane recepter protein n=1 Tax=Desulfacinum hydrothermale DSM 13146 TaxID=1121390 RepID=A0A1W1XCK2_9BACT|nr:TonB-dependent receptor [Desulfacinum hydrothermale]SMC21514.1 iron complex outermembrane recepter protein [Desulfacinum hydrothermale DSM 13146]
MNPRQRKRLVHLLAAISVMIWIWVGPALAAAPFASNRLLEMSLEELMDVEIVSVARKAQSLSETAAAVFVVTSEDIRRSGATNVADVLRMVPGLHVARFDANVWPVTARGFNGLLANKLLVLVDGRSVYTPIFSGVYWDEQDSFLDNIERIEVVRGPGGSSWGANAFNGVINIITKNARDTQGGLATALVGTDEEARAGFRYGGRVGDDLFYRFNVLGLDVGPGRNMAGKEGADDWRQVRAGWRADWQPSEKDAFLFTGGLYREEAGVRNLVPRTWSPYVEIVDFEREVGGGHLLGRWTRRLHDGGELQMQLYYDNTQNDNKILSFDVDTVDVDFQHRFRLGHHQEITWGMGTRWIASETEPGITTSFAHSDRTDYLWSAFVQDEISLADGAWRLTLGSKIERNDETGWEVQPTVRLLRRLGSDHSLWAAVSRAVRTPSQGEVESRIQSAVLPPTSTVPLPTLVVARGSRDMDSEKVWAFEAGVRTQVHPKVFLDLAGYVNLLEDLRSLEPAAPVSAGSYLVVESRADNRLQGRAYGLEAAAAWSVAENWQIQAAYTFQHMDLETTSGSLDEGSTSAEKAGPTHQMSLRSSWNLPRSVELDAWLRWVDELEALDVPDYWAADLRLSWKPLEHLELALVGRNLLDNRHLEFKQEILQIEPTEVERSVYMSLSWKF